MPRSNTLYLAFAFGVTFVSILLLLAVALPHPTSAQYTTFRIVLALAAAGVASVIPGFIQVQVSKAVRAGGALAVFAVVFFFSPAKLVANPPDDVVETTVRNAERPGIEAGAASPR
jgi:hypothetical protein